MARAKAAFEAEVGTWNAVFNEIGNHASLSYTLHEAAIQLAVDTLDPNDSANITKFIDDAVSTTSEQFAQLINSKHPISGSQVSDIIPLDDNPLYKYITIPDTVQIAQRTVGKPNDHYAAQLQLAAASTFLKGLKSDLAAIKPWLTDINNTWGAAPETFYLANSTSADARTKIDRLNGAWKKKHVGDADFEWGSTDGKVLAFIASTIHAGPTAFVDNLLNKTEDLEQILHAHWSSLISTAPLTWLTVYADNNYYADTAVPPAQRPVDQTALAAKTDSLVLDGSGAFDTVFNNDAPKDIANFDNIVELDAATVAAMLAPPAPPRLGGGGGTPPVVPPVAPPPPGGPARCVMKSIITGSTTTPLTLQPFKTLTDRELPKAVASAQSTRFPNLGSPAEYAAIMPPSIGEHEYMAKLFAFKHYTIQVFENLSFLHRTHLISANYDVAAADIVNHNALQEATATAIISALSSSWSIPYKQAWLSTTNMQRPTPRYVVYDTLMKIGTAYIGNRPIVESGITMLEDFY